jgi:hypothetical protein
MRNLQRLLSRQNRPSLRRPLMMPSKSRSKHIQTQRAPPRYQPRAKPEIPEGGADAVEEADEVAGDARRKSPRPRNSPLLRSRKVLRHAPQ